MASLPSAFAPTDATTASAQSVEVQPNRQQQPSTTSNATTTRKRRPRKKKPPPNASASNANIETNIETNTNVPSASIPPKNDSKQALNKSDALSRNEVRNAKRKMQRTKKKEEIQQQRKQHEWWRQQLPPDDPVDPITLESLHTLQYPPFALVASPPYVPIDWPPINNENEPDVTTLNNTTYTEEERQRQIIEEQWGKLRLDDHIDDDQKVSANTESNSNSSTKRHVNLFDGRALAYYMVSQSQFIDPLNRRDITRDELIHLNYYLRKYNFDELNVVEAYDTKGITLSSAGATANTAMGRSMILQQEARILLNALFGGTQALHEHHHPRQNNNNNNNNNSTSTVTNNTNSLMQQYEAYETDQLRHQQQQQLQRRRGNNQSSNNRNQYNEQRNTGIIHDSGMIIIDDDENPGLRGNTTTSTLYSANHISARYGQPSSGNVRENDFPSLVATLPVGSESVQETSAIPTTSKTLPKTKTLSKISKMVKQTNPEEQQRQWEAREAARRKAMLANLTFGANPTFTSTMTSDQSQQQQYLSDGIPSQISMTGPSEAQIERNRAFAEALGVQPATVRNSSTKLNGWMRPTEHTYELDEYGNELNVTIYPDSFIKHAKEMRYDIIIKLEKKWKLFLNDDKAASLPLYPMDKANRAFVHEYAEYWKLHTESFDPEPKRYVHCVKLRDTCAPYPLLSEAMKAWQPSINRNMMTSTGSTLPGPTSSAFYSNDHSTNQTAGQSTTSEQQREFPSDVNHQRVPLSLKPCSLTLQQQQQQHGTFIGTPIGGIPSRTMTESTDNHNRFDSLTDGRERPKLQLQKRTLPLDTPAQNVFDINDGKHEQQMVRQMMKQHKEKERNEKKQRALEAAFASDDEHDSDSEWVEQVAIYHSSSEDEHDDESFWK
jgi:hypothetical protein